MNFKLYGYGHWKWYDQVKIYNVIVIIPPRVLKEQAFAGYTSSVPVCLEQVQRTWLAVKTIATECAIDHVALKTFLDTISY